MRKKNGKPIFFFLKHFESITINFIFFNKIQNTANVTTKIMINNKFGDLIGAGWCDTVLKTAVDNTFFLMTNALM
jgi:hypothetical protein